MPTITALRRRGVFGELESVIPAITVPAWSCMMSGRDPGALGIYGFRNRADHTYSALFTANASFIRVPRLWDILTRHGLRSVVLNVPGTYPPTPIHGIMVGCFLTPSTSSAYTYPLSLKDEIRSWLNGADYPFDVAQFRTEDRDRV
ncbi:MAG: alkaline phosphatase family protein, partial [Anaerolinea sp.]|nr:alkaline phosphatase family protein [Anaerolinea sp.]